jgi:protein-S-isoprenylcysteine O-methyltransferase Ste14
MKMLPPVYFVIYWLAAVGIDRLVPAFRVVPPAARPVGAIVCAAGLLLIGWAAYLFYKHQTTIKPFECPAVLLMEGPYLFTRNPIYLGLVVILTGAVLYLGNFLTFAAPLAMFMTLEHIFIPMEEGNLRLIFGAAYRDYQKQVRRWL